MLTELVSFVWNLPPLVYVVITLGTLLYLMTRSRLPDNIPPFPCKPYLFLGHAPMMKSGPIEKFHEWRKSTGDIYSIYIGRNLFVVLNNLKMVKEAFVTQGDITSGRSFTFAANHLNNGKSYGIIYNAGPSWKEQRAVSMSILRNVGMGKTFLADKISIEVEAYLKALSDLKAEPTDVHILTNASVSNVICAILIGERFEFDDPYFVRLLKAVNEQFILDGNDTLLGSYPWLKYIPGDYFHAKKMVVNYLTLINFCRKLITDFQKKGGEDNVDNLIKAYQSEMEKKGKANIPTHLNEKNLLAVVKDLLIAGAETSSTTLLWALLFAIRHPDKQEKMYTEIVEVAGSERLPSIQDRSHMNYTNAFIMETQRLGSIVPFGFGNKITGFHVCTADAQVAGYTIPKDTLLISCLEEILKDEKTWGDPLVFRPERFLDKDNSLVVPEEFIPFSIGRRYCMGESLAKMELFLFITGIFQRFHVKPEDPENLPPTKPIFGLTCIPKAFKPRLVERKINV